MRTMARTKTSRKRSGSSTNRSSDDSGSSHSITRPDRNFPSPTDHHHLLWSRNAWKQGYASLLRRQRYLVAKIPRDSLHHHIHLEMSSIHVPDDAVCQTVFESMHEDLRAGKIGAGDSVLKRLDYLIDHLYNAGSDADTLEDLDKERQIIEEFYQVGKATADGAMVTNATTPITVTARPAPTVAIIPWRPLIASPAPTLALALATPQLALSTF